jgi:hypothetical protein
MLWEVFIPLCAYFSMLLMLHGMVLWSGVKFDHTIREVLIILWLSLCSIVLVALVVRQMP